MRDLGTGLSACTTAQRAPTERHWSAKFQKWGGTLGPRIPLPLRVVLGSCDRILHTRNEESFPKNLGSSQTDKAFIMFHSFMCGIFFCSFLSDRFSQQPHCRIKIGIGKLSQMSSAFIIDHPFLRPKQIDCAASKNVFSVFTEFRVFAK